MTHFIIFIMNMFHWIEVLLEYYGNIDELPEEQKEKLARSLRHYDSELAVIDDDEHRLSEILLECGFSKLKEGEEFDDFVIQYLIAEDPVDYLMEEVTEYAMKERDFFLYNMYKASRSNHEDFQKIIGEK